MSNIFNGLIERDAVSAYDQQDNCASGWKVGEQGCTRIVVYRESGGLGPETWLRVEGDDGKTHYAAARYYFITFAPEGDKGE